MKKLLILLSILFAFISCKNSVSTPNYKKDGNGGSQVRGGLNTSLPIWNVNYSPIPEEYWGKYQYLEVAFDYQRIRIATVTSKDITFSYKEDDGSFHAWAYFHVFDKNAEYQGNNTWYWNWNYDRDDYINKYKNDFRLSIIPPDIINFERNEKGQRVLLYKYYLCIHEDDMNK